MGRHCGTMLHKEGRVITCAQVTSPWTQCTSSQQHPVKVAALLCEPVHQTHPSWDKRLRSCLLHLLNKNCRYLGAANFSGSKTIVLPHSTHGTGPKVIRLEKKHTWQFSSCFHFGFNNAILVLVADTQTLKLASSLSIKPLTLKAILPSHRAAIQPPASVLLAIFQTILPFSASATPLLRRTQKAAPLAGGVQTKDLSLFFPVFTL